MKTIYAIIPAVLSAVPFTPGAGQSQDNSGTRKNVLFIMVDDLKPALNCFGDSFAWTPNIDALAARGTVFQQAYCQQALSGPSRCSILTGLRPDHLGIYGMDMLRDFYENPVSLPEYFRSQGYKTLAVGKLFDQRTVDPGADTKSWSIPYITPGKDEYFQGMKPVDGFRVPETAAAIKDSYAVAKSLGLKGGPANRYAKQHSEYTTECIDVPDNAYNDGVFADIAVREIEKLAKAGKPFFFGIGFHKPHLPFIAPKKYWDLYDRDSVPLAEFCREPENAIPVSFSGYKEILDWKDMDGAYSYVDDSGHTIAIDIEKQKDLLHGYYACVSYVDAQIGKVLDALTRNHLDSNTVVILVGDHGWHLGDHGLWAKHTNFEQAVHSPLIISAPDGEGRICRDVVEFVDIFPSVCSLAGLPIPEHLDGNDLSEVLYGGKGKTSVAVSQYPREGNIMGYSIRNDRFRYTVWLKKNLAGGERVSREDVVGEELYDYDNDPLETRNLSADPSYVEKLELMRGCFAEFADSQARTAAYHKERRIAGRDYFDGAKDAKSKELMSSVADSIDKYRKGDFTVELRDACTGEPVKGIVRFNLDKHKFRFGVSMYGISSLEDESLKEKAEKAIRKIFNTVTVCDYFKADALHGDKMPWHAEKDIAFAQANGKEMRFHAALFNVPHWIEDKNYSEQQCWDLIESRLKYVADNYSGTIDEYDIINEFINEFHYPGRAFYDNNPGYPQFRNPETARKVLDMTRRYLPDKKLVVLETSVASVNNPIFREIVSFYKDLVKEGGDFDYIGYQGHFYGSGDYRDGDRRYGKDTFTMGAISDALDMLGEIGKPVLITEFNGPSRRKNKDGNPDYPSWTLSDEENADWQINFYRLAFSKPYIEQITRWFLVDELGGVGLDAGLLDKSGKKHSIYDKLNYLINTEWDTDVKLPVTEGKTSFRGFYGRYEIEAVGYDKCNIELNESGNYVIRLNKTKQQDI